MDAKTIGERLVKLRGEKSRDEVAKSIGVSSSAIAMYELGERIPRDSIKIALANYYGVKIETLFYTS